MLFLTEALIFIFFKNNFIRVVFGDFLVVILLYCLFRTFTNLSIYKTGIFVLFISYTIETLQYLNILELLNIKQNLFTRIVLGSTFDWMDMLAYTLGLIFIVVIDIFIYIKLRKKTNRVDK